VTWWKILENISGIVKCSNEICEVSVAYKDAEFSMMYVMLGGMVRGKIFN
jgi:hypothetical protein